MLAPKLCFLCISQQLGSDVERQSKANVCILKGEMWCIVTLCVSSVSCEIGDYVMPCDVVMPCAA